MKTDLRKPCNECPFRKKSAPGWLGPWDPADLLTSIAYAPFPCHQTIKEKEMLHDDDRLQGCSGAAIYLNKKLELSRCPETREHQKKLRDLPEEEREKVFANRLEFLEHHCSVPGSIKP